MEETIRYHIEIHSKANRIRPMFGNSISIVGVGRFNPCKSVFLYGNCSSMVESRIVIPVVVGSSPISYPRSGAVDEWLKSAPC